MPNPNRSGSLRLFTFSPIYLHREVCFDVNSFFYELRLCTFAGNKLALIDIIETILVTLSAESRIEGVNTVLKQLQRCNDLTVFEDVIEYVRANIDNQKYPMLGELL